MPRVNGEGSVNSIIQPCCRFQKGTNRHLLSVAADASTFADSPINAMRVDAASEVDDRLLADVI